MTTEGKTTTKTKKAPASASASAYASAPASAAAQQQQQKQQKQQVGGDKNNRNNGGKNNGGKNNRGKNGGKNGGDKNGGKKGGCGFIDKELKHDGSSAELAYVQDAAEWYNHFLERISFKDVERLAEEAPKRYINWDVVRLMAEMRAIYTRIVSFASDANKEADQAKRMYETVRHPQLSLRGFPITETDTGDWLDLYAKKDLHFGNIEISNFIKLHSNEIGFEAHSTRSRSTCITNLKYSIRNGTFTARVAMLTEGGEYTEDKYVTFRVDTERSVISVVGRAEDADDYGAVVLVDVSDEVCFSTSGAQGRGRSKNNSLRSRQPRATNMGSRPRSRRQLTGSRRSRSRS